MSERLDAIHEFFLGVGNFSIFDTIDLCSNAFKNEREDLELFAPLPGFLKLFKN